MFLSSNRHLEMSKQILKLLGEKTHHEPILQPCYAAETIPEICSNKGRVNRLLHDTAIGNPVHLVIRRGDEIPKCEGQFMVKRPRSSWGIHVYPTFDLQGRLRELFDEFQDVDEYVVERMYMDPALVNGSKADLRVHVVTWSHMGRLRWKLHTDVLVRLTSVAFDARVDDWSVHVTNPRHNNFCELLSETRLSEHEHQIHANVDACVSTFFDTLVQEGLLSRTAQRPPVVVNDLWLWGFDLFLHESMDVSFIEVNSQPAVAASRRVDPKQTLFVGLRRDVRKLVSDVGARRFKDEEHPSWLPRKSERVVQGWQGAGSQGS